jgi:hypothetical protein
VPPRPFPAFYREIVPDLFSLIPEKGKRVKDGKKRPKMPFDANGLARST